MASIIIHAGFPKTGSSAIQRALRASAATLSERSIFVFGADLTVRPGTTTGMPAWHLEAAKRRMQPLAADIGAETVKVGDDATFVISAENLANRGFAEMFRGLDDMADVTLIFYVRPQIHWLASAWAQFGVHKGRRIGDYVENALSSGHPNYMQRIRAWQTSLPQAHIGVRPLIPDFLFDGGADTDFFHSVLHAGEALVPNPSPTNASFDYSLLHLLSRNPEIFTGRRIDKVYHEIRKRLPLEYLSTNAPLLDSDRLRAIEERYREENIELLETFCAAEIGDVRGFYQRHFVPKTTDRPAYSRMDDAAVDCRAVEILAAACGTDADGANGRQLVESVLTDWSKNDPTKRPRPLSA